MPNVEVRKLTHGIGGVFRRISPFMSNLNIHEDRSAYPALSAGQTASLVSIILSIKQHHAPCLDRLMGLLSAIASGMLVVWS